jgi:hypothetical protein
VASSTLGDMAEVAANGFRGGLTSHVGPYPRGQIVRSFAKYDREVANVAQEIFSRGHDVYIPAKPRARFVRAMQDEFEDLLGFNVLIEEEEPEG